MRYFVLLLCIYQISLANASNEITPTRYGNLEIKAGLITLDSSPIYKTDESMMLNVEKIFKIAKNDVILVRESTGGSGTIDSFLFITLISGKSPIVSESFLGQENEIKPVQNKDKITIDLGFNEGKQEVLIYENGSTSIHKSKVKKSADKVDDDCNNLYNEFYQPFVKNDNCSDEVSEVSGMITVRMYNALSQNPFINFGKFEQLAKTSCKKSEIIKYSDFKKVVCSK
jgi:hypothetical protein